MQSRSDRVRNWAVLVGLTVLFLGLDQLTKWLVRQNLAVNEAWAPIPALAKFFTVTHVQNTGVSFGQLPGLGWVFLLVNLVVLIGVLVYYPRIQNGQWPLRLALALLLAGALGNMIDRLWTTLHFSQQTGSMMAALRMAYVTDFVDFKFWPVWNVSDMCVVGGTAILAWWLWRSERETAATDAMADET